MSTKLGGRKVPALILNNGAPAGTSDQAVYWTLQEKGMNHEGHEGSLRALRFMPEF